MPLSILGTKEIIFICLIHSYRSLAQMSLLFGNVVRGLSAGARVFEFINTTPTVPLSGGKKIPFHSLNGHIEFHDVRFSYPTRSEQV
jgi:ATP-binding cassette subfamily B (MDR/TAP) protein 8